MHCASDGLQIHTHRFLFSLNNLFFHFKKTKEGSFEKVLESVPHLVRVIKDCIDLFGAFVKCRAVNVDFSSHFTTRPRSRADGADGSPKRPLSPAYYPDTPLRNTHTQILVS